MLNLNECPSCLAQVYVTFVENSYERFNAAEWADPSIAASAYSITGNGLQLMSVTKILQV